MNLFEAEDSPPPPVQARVSISDRVVPAISFGLTSVSGIIAAIMTTAMFTALRDEENAGMDSIVEAFDKIESVVLVVLGLSVAIGVASIITLLVRMSSDRHAASPPGFVYLLAGIPNLASPLLVVNSWFVVIEVLAGRYAGDATQAGAQIGELMVYAIVVGIGTSLTLPVFAFVPFNARRGKKITSLVGLSVVIVCIVAIAIAFLGVADGLARIPPTRTY